MVDLVNADVLEQLQCVVLQIVDGYHCIDNGAMLGVVG